MLDLLGRLDLMDRPPSHPHLPAAVLMVAVSIFLVLAAALGLG